MFILFFQVLHQVSPMPEEVRMDSALQAPEKNRSMQYLPREPHASPQRVVEL